MSLISSSKTLATQTQELLRLTYRHLRDHGAKATVRRTADILRERYMPRETAAADVVHERSAPVPIPSEQLIEQRFNALTSMNTYSIPRTKARFNLVTDSLSPGSFYGRVGTSLILAGLLAEKAGCDLRIITRNERADQQAFAQMMHLAGITLPARTEFRFAECHAPRSTDLDLGAKELFLTTSWWSTWATLRTVTPSKIVYLLQEDERMFYPHGDDHIRCSTVLKNPNLTCVVNSKLMFDHLVGAGLPHLAEQGMWFEPSFPEELFFPPPEPPKSDQRSRFFFYARPNNLRNAFCLGLEAIHHAITNGVLDPSRWEIHFVGKDIPETLLPGQVAPVCHSNMSWQSYAALVRRMDLGLSLMCTPHPSYPPLDLAASGAVAVTNRFGTKQNLDRYSKNILCVEPTVQDIVNGLEQGVLRSQDWKTRMTNYRENELLRDWRTSFAGVLDSVAGRLA